MKIKTDAKVFIFEQLILKVLKNISFIIFRSIHYLCMYNYRHNRTLSMQVPILKWRFYQEKKSKLQECLLAVDYINK